ncbi:non-homologous end-joining factor 1 [Brachionichthys hirsutus]|uniref:non-homologous end-joining factor 1 n=1 Tax=Brachionichthys hirsutus TaxID=412623 RepID=UPI003604ABCF
MEPPGGSDPLLQRPWLPVNIAGCQLLAKSWFGETAYRILLTDTHGVWEERMEAAAIQERAQELNRRLRAPVQAFFSHLRDVAQPRLLGSAGSADDEARISLTRREDGGVRLKLKSELAGLPFYWEFRCSPAPVAAVCVHLVRPLLTMSRLLQRQVQQLGGLLARKDAEIQDYRENGATPSRERLQTDVFQETTYREDFTAKTLPLLRSEQHHSLTFDPDLQHLYAAVVAHGSVSPVGESVSREAAEDREQDKQANPPGPKMADRPAVRQRLPVPSDAAERPSKPKKKKVVGLFR